VTHSVLTRAVGIALPLAAVFVVAACGSNSNSGGSSSGGSSSGSSSSGSSSSNSSSGSGTTAASTSGTVITTRSGPDGTYLAGGSGRAVYLWTADSSNSSMCSGACASAWPPVIATGHLTASGGAASADLGTIMRSDGTKQVTYGGHPLYYFAGDSGAGMTNGQGSNGFGAKWWLITPSSAAALTSTGSTANSGGSSSSPSGGSSGSSGGTSGGSTWS
jgi:predicted lipoprotein with Yx(FWY)xxD motif